MKSYLRHLLDKLNAEKPGFQNITIHHNGKAMAIYNGAPIHFDSLDDMESWAYRPAQAAPTEHVQRGSDGAWLLQCQCEKCAHLRAPAPTP